MKKYIYKHAGVLTALWAGIIFILCATPGQYIPSANWLDLLSFDKWVHAGMFFTLCVLFFITAVKRRWSFGIIIIIFFTCILYGGLLEIMQAKCFSNRSADWEDFAANSFGCCVAFLFLRKWRKNFAATL